VRGVTDLIVMPGLINLDFADIKSVISEMGKAMMGTGEAEGEDRASRAADMAISNPLLDDVTMKGAKGVLINITGGPDLMLFEVEQAANRIRAEVDPDANIIFGNTILPEMEGRIRVSVVATGIDAELSKMPLPSEKVRTLHPHLAVKQPPRVPQPAPVAAAAPAPVNPVHATMEALAQEMGAPKGAAGDYVLGGADAPEIAPDAAPAPSAPRYAATESYRPLEQQPLAPRMHAPAERKGGWSIFGRKKAAPDLRGEPMHEPRMERMPERMPAPRANVQPMQPIAAPPEQQRADDLFPDHKRDEQFEIPAFLRRQSN
jgi:cell division protein FtsZ